MTTTARRVSTADRTSFVMPYMAAWDAHDVDGILSFLADDVRWAHPGLPEPLHGTAAVRRDLEGIFAAFPDIHFPAEDQVAFTAEDPSRVIVTWTHHATMRGVLEPGYLPTGKTVRATGVCLYRFRDGLIVEHTMVFDGLDYLQQLGLLPGEEKLTFKVMLGAHNAMGRAKALLRR